MNGVMVIVVTTNKKNKKSKNEWIDPTTSRRSRGNDQ